MNSEVARCNDASPIRIIRSRHDSLMARANHSAYAFRLGDRAGSRIELMAAVLRMDSNSSVNREDRSWMNYRHSFRKPSRPSVRLRAICYIQGPVGSGMIPAIFTARLANRMTKNT